MDLQYVEEDKITEYVGKTLKVKLITVDKENSKLVMSAREFLKEKADKERAEMISNVEVGLVTEGVVESLQNYGAFVNLGNGMTGLVHISQLDKNRVEKTTDIVNLGDEIIVKALGYDNRGRLNLSRKEALPKDNKQKKDSSKK